MTTRFAGHLLTGDHASRPAFGAVPEGTLYACSTHAKVYQSDGATAWTDWATLGGGSPAAHAASHEDGGADEIDVTGLSGVLADAQTPILPIAQSDVTNLVTDLAAKASDADLTTEISDRTSGDTALDTRIDALESATTPPEAQGTWLASGGAVVFLQDYDFTVSAATYYINGTLYTAPQTDVTLDAADATFDRFDAIAVNASGAAVNITGTPASNPALPDVDPETELALTYILVQAASSAPAITLTNIYLENTEWTSSVSGGTINAASTSNPFAGTTDIEATASAAGHYVRLTNGAPVSLADKKQLILNIRSKAAWPNPKSLQITWYLSGAKIGQSVALSNSKYGFLTATTGVYQQVVIPISAFAVPSSSTVDRLEFLVSGSGSTIGFYLDNVILEAGSADVTPPSVGAATATTLGLVRTDVTDANPQVYLKASVDTALAFKAPLASPTFTGTPTAPTATGGTNTTQIATTAFVTAAVGAGGVVSSVFGRTGAVVKVGGDYAVADVTGAAPLASPALTGTPTAPTASAADNSTKIATTAYVDTADALKANLASPTFTGTPAAPTATGGTNTTQIATTAFVAAALAGGAGAPTGASYVTLGTDATLTSERVLTAGSGISLTDNGAGTTIVVSATGVGGGTPPSTPPSTGLIRWYKADAGVTSSSSRVSLWADQSSAALDAAQATGGNQPLLVTNSIDGLPVIRFVRARGDRMTCNLNALIDTNNWYAFCVGKRTSTISAYFFGAVSGGGNNTSLHCGWATSTIVMNFWTDDLTPAAAVYSATNETVELMTFSRVTGKGRRIRLGNTTLATGTYGSLTSINGGGVIGGAVGDWGNIDIAEMLIYGGSATFMMTEETIAEVRAYLLGRYPSAKYDL